MEWAVLGTADYIGYALILMFFGVPVLYWLVVWIKGLIDAINRKRSR